MKTSNIFANIPKNLDNEVFEELLKQKNITIERIISYGHITAENEWYDQEDNEWVILLQGEAILSYENGDDLKMKIGDYVNIPAHTKHRVSWTIPDQETIWLALHFI